MRSATTLTTTALLGLGLLAAPGASAAGATCQDRPATIVGADRTTPVTGTDGPDVIVATGARVIDAGGGDDLICVVDAFVRRLDAGAGDDVVDVSAGYGSRSVLGAGADTYIGSPGTDEVWGGTREADGSGRVDRDPDVIDTGGDQSADSVVSGERGVPNGDRVRLGVLSEVVWSGVPTASSELTSVGLGFLDLEVSGRDEVTIDNASGVMTFAGAPALTIPGFQQFTVRSPSGPRTFDFQGGDAAEVLDLDFPRPRAHRVDMGQGRNQLGVSVGRPLVKRTSYRAGAGRDSVRVTLPTGEVDVHLGRQRLMTRSDGLAVRTRVDGFEAATAVARSATLVGTSGRNALYVDACHGRVEGLAGGDSLGAVQPNHRLRCDERSVVALGGTGRDFLTGSPGPDVLLGGAGTDHASGRGGRDACEAESRSSCEVRR